MATQQELGDLIYATALAWVPQGGGIAEVQREGVSVVLVGQQPRGLRGIYDPPTAVLAAVELDSVRVIILGGRPGIPQGQQLMAVPVAGREPHEVANEVVVAISNYLAQTTS
jgi:hypothetical protein